MTFKIHFVSKGFEDEFTVKGQTLEELREKADAELAKRAPLDDYWSEEVKE